MAARVCLSQSISAHRSISEKETQILSSRDLIDKPAMQHSELKYMRYKAVQHFCSSEVDLHADMLRNASQSSSCRGKKVMRKRLRRDASCSKSAFASFWGNVSQLIPSCSAHKHALPARSHKHIPVLLMNSRLSHLGFLTVYVFFLLYLYHIHLSFLPFLLHSGDSFSSPGFSSLTCAPHACAGWHGVTHASTQTHIYRTKTLTPFPKTKPTKV